MTARSQLTSYLTGKWIPPVLGVVARLGVPDHVAQHGPATAAELAVATGADADALHRVLRAAASVGVLEEDDSGRFAMTEMAELLRSDAADSLRAAAMMFSLEPFWSPYSKILDSVMTGEPAFEKQFGSSVYDYLWSHPDDAAIFGQTLGAFHAEGLGAIATAYDFAGFDTVADLGGGDGSLLTALLTDNSSLEGVLLELGSMLDAAETRLVQAGVRDRVQLVEGDFFVDVPAKADCYVIKSCIHNFSDDEAVAVLSTVARAMGPEVPLIVAETVVPPGNDPHYSKLDDIEMLVIAGGQDRTQAQYASLLSAAGLRLARAIPAGDRFTLLESFVAGPPSERNGEAVIASPIS